jgi:hypothetical protein
MAWTGIGVGKSAYWVVARVVYVPDPRVPRAVEEWLERSMLQPVDNAGEPHIK